MKNEIREVAIAIIHQEGKFLIQLRDDIPTIIYPSCWALFGGHLEAGETAELALIREIKEEINYDIVTFSKFRDYQNKNVIRHVFHFPLTVRIEDLTLGEGWDFALVSPEVIKLGSHYSEKAKQIKPFADIHQQILLDFLKI